MKQSGQQKIFLVVSNKDFYGKQLTKYWIFIRLQL